jgi:hypothetical protein
MAFAIVSLMKSALHPWPRGTPFAPLFHSKIISQTSFVNYYYVVSSDSPTRRFVEAVFLKRLFLEDRRGAGRYNTALHETLRIKLSG